MTAKMHTLETGKTYGNYYGIHPFTVTIQRRTRCYAWTEDGTKHRIWAIFEQEGQIEYIEVHGKRYHAIQHQF